MDFGVRVRQLGQIVQSFTQSLYQPPAATIPGINPTNWPTASQPVNPIGPPGSQPLGMPITYGQNLIHTPRADAEYDFISLRRLSTYPLARICIENVKDQLCQLPWHIRLRAMPGESTEEVRSRRRKEERGDNFIKRVSKFLERPDGRNDWGSWLRLVLEDMLSIDAASVQIQRTFNGKLARLRWVPGHTINRYVDDNGDTPAPPAPAYAQLWEGMPRVNLSQDQLMYCPRNIVPRSTLSSYLYGFSPTEQMADEIQIGMARLQSVMRFYDAGAIPEFLHIVPAKASPKQMQDAMDWVNTELAGNLDRRRQYRIIQGFSEDGKGDQIIFPKEPVLADVFDDLHIRKICFGYGTAPQRLMRMMNRASAQVSQKAAEVEGIRPWKAWIENALIGLLISRLTGSNGRYEMVLDMDNEADELKRTKTQALRVGQGLATINDINREEGRDVSSDPAADQLGITTPTGRVPISMLPPSGTPVPKGPVGGVPTKGQPEPANTPPPPKKGYVNGHSPQPT